MKQNNDTAFALYRDTLQLKSNVFHNWLILLLLTVIELNWIIYELNSVE